MHVLTALHDLPADSGFLHFEPFTHWDGRFHNVTDCESPPPSHEPPAVPVVLRKGESVIWLYSTKHAAVPNPTAIERSLLYTVYGIDGFEDRANHQEGLPHVLSEPGDAYPEA